jgi:hypothetical protein
MNRSITFCAEDLAFIKNLQNSTPSLNALAEHLKKVTYELVADETICLELSDELIQKVIIAEKKWTDDSGIINHIAIQFFHDKANIITPAKPINVIHKGSHRMRYEFTLEVLPMDDGGKEFGGTNELAFWSSTLPSGTTLTVQIERGGNTEFEVTGPHQQGETTLSKDENSVDAAEQAITLLTEIKEAIEQWKQSYSPVTIKDDTIDYWHNLNGEEFTGDLHIPWIIQIRGGESVKNYIGSILGHTKGLGFTQAW